MGVYIPNMKFPQNCGECDLLYDCCACGVTHKRMDFETMDRVRNPHCTLVSVPSHLRLVWDKHVIETFTDAILAEAEKTGKVRATSNEIIAVVSAVPTIIPAEEE